jgi:hypothetical protein
LIKNITFGALKKVDGSVFFWSDFDDFLLQWRLIGFIEKRPPQKALCLGPDPPPGEKWKFIEKTRFLTILWPSIEPEKLTVKSASTPYPPRNDHFIGFLIIRDPISSLYHFLLKLIYYYQLVF